MTETTIRDKAIERAKKRRARQLETLRAGVSRRGAKIEREYRAAIVAASEECIRAINLRAEGTESNRKPVP